MKGTEHEAAARVARRRREQRVGQQRQRRQALVGTFTELARDFAAAPEQIGHYLSELMAAGKLDRGDAEVLRDALAYLGGDAFAANVFAGAGLGPYPRCRVTPARAASRQRLPVAPPSVATTPHAGARIDGQLRAAGPTVPSNGGVPLTPAVRAREEGRLGTDLSAVRVHQDSEASRVAEAYRASAFTLGNHIFAGSEAGDLMAGSGASLLGHELEHVVQGQRDPGLAREILRQPSEGGDEAASETPQERLAETIGTAKAAAVFDAATRFEAEDAAGRTIDPMFLAQTWLAEGLARLRIQLADDGAFSDRMAAYNHIPRFAAANGKDAAWVARARQAVSIWLVGLWGFGLDDVFATTGSGVTWEDLLDADKCHARWRAKLARNTGWTSAPPFRTATPTVDTAAETVTITAAEAEGFLVAMAARIAFQMGKIPDETTERGPDEQPPEPGDPTPLGTHYLLTRSTKMYEFHAGGARPKGTFTPLDTEPLWVNMEVQGHKHPNMPPRLTNPIEGDPGHEPGAAVEMMLVRALGVFGWIPVDGTLQLEGATMNPEEIAANDPVKAYISYNYRGEQAAAFYDGVDFLREFCAAVVAPGAGHSALMNVFFRWSDRLRSADRRGVHYALGRVVMDASAPGARGLLARITQREAPWTAGEVPDEALTRQLASLVTKWARYAAAFQAHAGQGSGQILYEGSHPSARPQLVPSAIGTLGFGIQNFCARYRATMGQLPWE